MMGRGGVSLLSKFRNSKVILLVSSQDPDEFQCMVNTNNATLSGNLHPIDVFA